MRTAFMESKRKKAYNIAQQLQQTEEEARWFLSWFDLDLEKCRAQLDEKERTPRQQYYYAVVVGLHASPSTRFIRLAANQGYAPAQAHMSWFDGNHELAQAAVDQGDSDGLIYLAYRANVLSHHDEAKLYLKIAIDAGNSCAMEFYITHYLYDTGLHGYYILALAAADSRCVARFREEAKLRKNCGPIAYQLGRVPSQDTCTDVTACIDTYIRVENTRAAIFTWLLFAPSVGLYKDVALLIARIAWSLRYEK